MHHMFDDGFYWGWHLFWWGFWVLLLILVIVMVWRSRGQSKSKDTPMEILKERYARGEIDEEEYEERKRVLKEK